MSVMVSVAMSQVGMTELIFVNPGVKVNGQYYCDVLLSQQMLPAIKRVAQRCLFTKQYVAYGEIGHFLCSVISKGKVVTLDRWGGKWNHLSMTHRLATNYAKNYCNRTLIVKVIVENGVTCFFGTRCISLNPISYWCFSPQKYVMNTRFDDICNFISSLKPLLLHYLDIFLFFEFLLLN